MSTATMAPVRLFTNPFELERVWWGSCPLLGVEVFLPSQVGRARRPRPEQALLAALVEDALRCAAGRLPTPVKGDGSLARVVREARAWLAGAPALITFREACEHLGVDPTWLRRHGTVVPAHKRPRLAGRVPVALGGRP